MNEIYQIWLVELLAWKDVQKDRYNESQPSNRRIVYVDHVEEMKRIADTSVTQGLTDERQEFEAWAIDQDLNITRGLRGEYSYMEPAYAWRVWQGIAAYRNRAILAQAAPQPSQKETE